MSDTRSLTGSRDALATRHGVIADSGWGSSVRIIQVRNVTFWAALLLLIHGAATTLTKFRVAADAYTESFAQGLAWFTVFALAFLWFFARLDRHAAVPAKAKVVAFAFGALVAPFGLAAINNDAVISILSKTVGLDFAQAWGAAVAAPWSEEVAKLLPVIVVIALAPRAMRGAFDGLIVGAISGLAFQVVEDVAYTYQQAAANFGQTEFGTQTLALRTVVGISGHWTWSGVAGAGLVYLIGRPAQPPRRLLGAAMILFSIGLHFAWDAISEFSSAVPAPLLMLLFTLINLIVFIGTYTWTVRQERTWARALLEPEVDAGVITSAELEAAVGSRRTRRHHITSQPHHRRTKHVLAAISELADDIAKAHGADTPAVDHARSEIARLRG